MSRRAAAVAAAARAIAACRICRRRAAGGRVVVGEGNPHATIVFVGEAPGRHEAESGRPFVGRAGKWLRRAIGRVGFSESAVYLTNLIPYRSADAPRAADIDHGRLHAITLLGAIRPRVVVLLGATACTGLLNERVAIARRHGEATVRDPFVFFITFHPAAAARFPVVRRKALADLRRLSALAREGNFAMCHGKDLQSTWRAHSQIGRSRIRRQRLC